VREIPHQTAAALLPDHPRWVEVRSMLLAGRGSVLGAEKAGPPSFVVFDSDTDVAAVIGRPPQDLVRFAARYAAEVLVVKENADWTAAALPEWTHEIATLHVLGPRPQLPPVTPGAVRYVADSELTSWSPRLPPTLRDELVAESQRGTKIAAAFAGDQPVAFCYAGSVTERWWDVSIDTLEGYRRQGYAARCVAYCIQEMARHGIGPVWGAFQSNTASMRLAGKLGFEAVDELVVFSGPANLTNDRG
jgi:GNAT superfamily N-acetyltransferase